MKKKVLENIVKWIFLLCGIAAVGFVLCICLYLVISGVPAIREIGLWNFLFGKVWASTAAEPKFGILPFILTSVYGTAGAILLGVPVGFLTAVYLAKLAPPKVKSMMQSAVSLLAGIPSVVYGLVGMIVLVPAIRNLFHLSSGACLLAAMIVLAIMILPTIMRTTEEALRSIPQSYREASFGLGAGRLRTVFVILLPTALPGILGGVLLSVGRIVGETAALIYTAGTVAKIAGLTDGGRTLAVHMYALIGEGLYTDAAYATAVVLLAVVILLNALSDLLLGKHKKGDSQ